MSENDLLTLAEREIARLTDENDHCAAVIMRALVENIRAKNAEKIASDYPRSVRR